MPLNARAEIIFRAPMPLRPGDPIPRDLLVLGSSGERHALATAFGGAPGLLIYLRHLG